MCKKSNNEGSLRLFARRTLLVFKAGGKGLLALVLLVVATQLFLIGCGSTVYKTGKDAEGKTGNDSGLGDTAGAGGVGGTSGGGGKTRSVGGTVTGLQGTGLVLQNNGGNDLPISTDGSFTFHEAFADGSSYAVTVKTQPSGTNRICTVKNGAGKLAGADVTDVEVSCVEPADTDWAKVSAGFDYSCAIKTNGSLFCWGDNSYGQLGDNSTTESQAPVQESSASTDWTRVSAGKDYACGVKTNGKLFCWGYNHYGQLGNDSTEESYVLVQENTAATDWASVSAGRDHTCAVKTNGTLFCWGNNYYGQLGNDSTEESRVPVQESAAATDWVNVSVGGGHTCAVKTNGTLFCWGENFYGILGNNSTDHSPVPVQESTATTDWANVSASDSYTCAIKTNGKIYCWGRNYFGGLGNNPTADSPVPVQESTAATDWANVSAGGGHTCAVKTNGTLSCWGNNESGQLGNNSFHSRGEPVQESTAVKDWANVSAGYYHTCAVKTNGTLFCWGGGHTEVGMTGTSGHYTSVSYSSTLNYGLVPVQVSTAATDWASLSADYKW
jgi:alpha-tubulin suppressor-like RCC1 family protein